MPSQDTSLVVREHACDVKTLTVAVTPLGNPSTYRDLPTPGGHSYDVFSNSTADPVSGTVTSFFFPAPEAAATDPDLCFLIVNSRRGGEDVTVGITATSAWWATEREDADLRAAMLRCFPHFPTAWHEDCVREAMDAPAAAPRCDPRSAAAERARGRGGGRHLLWPRRKTSSTMLSVLQWRPSAILARRVA